MARIFRAKADSLEAVPHRAMDEMQEKDLERLILTQPLAFGEPLVFIGQQADFPEIGGDAVDILALDREGATVIIELKRGVTPSSTDFQVLKYAGFVRGLNAEDLSARARDFFSRASNIGYRKSLEAETGLDLTAGIDLAEVLARKFKSYDLETYEDRINNKQRILVAAEDFDNRIIAAIVWLRSVGADATAVRYRRFPMDGGDLFSFTRLIPGPELEAQLAEASKKGSDRAWLKDGRAWHMDEEHTYAPNIGLLADFERMIQGVSGLNLLWGQKYYVKLMGPQGRELRVHPGTKKGRLDLIFMHANFEGISELLKQYDLKLELQKSHMYEKESPWIGVSASADFTAPLKSAITAWLVEQT